MEYSTCQLYFLDIHTPLMARVYTKKIQVTHGYSIVYHSESVALLVCKWKNDISRKILLNTSNPIYTSSFYLFFRSKQDIVLHDQRFCKPHDLALLPTYRFTS